MNISAHLSRRLSAATIAVVGFVSPMVSQQIPNVSADTAIADYGTDSINLQTLTPMFVAPIRTKGGVSVSLGLASLCTVVNNTWECGAQNVGGPRYSYLPIAQVSGLLGYALQTSTTGTTLCPSNGQFYGTLGNWVLEDRSYNRFTSLGGYIITNCPNQSQSSTTTDGSGLTLTLKSDASGNMTASLSDKFGNATNSIPLNGPTIYYPSSVSDTFGNVVSGTVTSSITEPLSPSDPALIETAQNSQGIPTAWKYHDPANIYRNITLSTGSITLSSSLGCGETEESGTRSIINSINYPDNTSDTFTYYADGRLKTITLRTGGVITYTYGSMDCTFHIPISITRHTVDGTWTYTMAPGTNFTSMTTVLDPGKNQTVYSFASKNGAAPLTQVQVYQNVGTVANPSNSLLTTDLICYNGNTSTCVTTNVYYPITEKAVTHTIAGMSSSSQTVTYYDGGPSSGCAQQSSPCYHNVTEVDRHDFGAFVPTIKESISYGSWNGSACVYVGSNIYGKPCDVTTTDNARPAHTISETRYTYGPPGHLDFEYDWSGSQWLTVRTSAGNANGTDQYVTNSLGLTTNYSYAATGSGGCNALLPTGTSTTFPTGDVLTTGQTWDCNMGKLLSSTDENSNTSQFTYDLLGRPASQTDPLGYAVGETYPSATTATMSDPYRTTRFTVDGLGRTIRSQTTDGSSYDTVTTYRSFNGAPNFYVETSQPCLTTLGADCALAGSLAYDHYNFVDPLGRSISKSTNFREVYNSTYTQNDVSVELDPAPTTENPKKVQTEYDGLGRVISTCAIKASGGTACGQVDGNSGILTTYSYFYGAGSTTIRATRGSQVHTTVYDALGRVLSSATPESGTTNYTYDTASATCGSSSYPGTLVEQVNANGTHICFVRDQAGRLSTSYTPINGVWHNCRSFVRGEFINDSQHPTQPTGSGTYSIGRIAESQVDYNCNSTWTPVEWFSYDKVGRITDVWEITAHSGGTYHTTVSYYPNGELNTLSGVPGKSSYTVGLNSNGRPYSSSLGSTVIINSVQRNASGQTTNFGWGTGGNNDAYAYDPYTGKMTGYTFTVGSLTDAGVLTWNPNGTLQKLAITDGINSGGSQTCTFTYDDVARLVTDNCGSIWNQGYSYDQYDNLTKTGNPGTSWNPGYQINNPSNNQIIGANYDPNGRVTYDLNNSYSWDEYGKMTAANGGASLGTCGGTGVTCITYDAFGRLVEKQVGGTFSEFLYSPHELTATMSGQTVSNFRVPLPGGADFNQSAAGSAIGNRDWLGSVRLTTDLNGTTGMDTAYTPYGEIYDHFGSINAQNFTGDYQDLLSGLYDTPARELSQTSGSRWLSPDPVQASWNAYAYVTNPNRDTDPSGLLGIGGNALPRASALLAGWYLNCEELTGWACTESPSELYSDWFNAGGPGSWWRIFPTQGSAFPINTSGNQIFTGQDSPFFEPLSLGSLWSDVLGLPSGLSCPQVGGLSDFICGGVSPISDAEAANNGTPTIGPDNGKSKPNVPPEWGFCSGYRDGTGAGDAMYHLCMSFPNGPWSNCVRGKLLNQWTPNGNPLDLSIYLFWDHPKDFAACAMQ